MYLFQILYKKFTKLSTSDRGQIIKEEEDEATVLDLFTKGIESTSDGGQIIKEEEDGAIVLDFSTKGIASLAA